MSQTDERAETLKQIGAMLRKARQDKDTSLRGLGAKTGVSVAYLCDVEFGRRSFSPGRLREIADAVGMNEAARTRLFTTANMLPPAVRERVAKSPKTWSYDPQKVLQVALDLKKKVEHDAVLASDLGSDFLAALQKALQKVEW